ncbi:MAG: HAMP domain-containing sensor histidine kinase [Bacillota bacterium]|nr:HAMP domain-containing sensor histidine kinase [Bacillota bacterium]MDW7677584.1 HAMP domain-containing sensor histidine kinase [Bacillota bacterium]
MRPQESDKDRNQSWLLRIMGLFFFLYNSIKESVSSLINKSIYTRITVVNVVSFIVCLSLFIALYSSSVNRMVSQYAEQDLLRKATRSNFALLQREDWQWLAPSSDNGNTLTEGQEDLIKFLADVFDARITVFDMEGNLVATSAKQEVVPGTKVDQKYIDAVIKGETYAGHFTNRDSDERVYIGVVPMGESDENIQNGILLEATSARLNRNLSQNRFNIMSAGAFMMLVMLVISLHQAMHLSRPINELTTAVVELNTGQYTNGKKPYTLIELADLSDQIRKLSVKMSRIQEENKGVESERTRLFAEISHELRTPLTAVQGYVEAIQDGIVQDQEMLDRYLDIIYSQTLHINRLVDDLLQLSRLESGVISLEKVPLDLVPIVRQVMVSMDSFAMTRNTTISLKESPSEAIILGDLDRLQQIVKNLVSNALNATESGEVIMNISLNDTDVVLSIQDTGVGISNEDLPHIWDRFFQSRTYRKSPSSHHGSGLGLVIVKQLVELHQGKIDVKSQLGHGTTFTLTFPLMETQNNPGG